MKFSLLTALLLSGLVSAGMEPIFKKDPQIAVTPHAKQAEDGVRTEEEDRFSVGMFGFCPLLANRRELLPPDARFNVATDRKSLFISAQCETGPDGILERARKGRGGERAFLDDSFELVVVPDPKEVHPAVYHIFLNNRGSYMATAKKGSDTLGWEPLFNMKGMVKERLWTWEVSLPLAQFGLNEWKDGQTIGLRICRNWRRMKKEFGGDWGCQSAWGQNWISFFSADSIPLVTLYEEAPVIRLLSLRKGNSPDIRVSLFNPTSREMPLNMTYRHQPKNCQSVSRDDPITLKPGETKIMVLPTAQLTEGEIISTSIQFTSSDNQKVFYRRSFSWQLEKPDAFASENEDKQKIAFNYAYYPESDKLYAVADLGALKNSGSGKTVSLEIKDKSGKSVAKTQMPPPKDGKTELLWNVPPLKEITRSANPSGEYTLTVIPEGIPEVAFVKNFERKIFEWEGNSLGKSDRLIAPFTPIQVRGDTVSTILRDHTMTSIGLWKQVCADGENLLKENGITVEAVIDGKTHRAQGQLRFTEKRPTKVIAVSQWNAGSLNASSVSDWDYDGMMKYTLTLHPMKDTIQSLKMIIPVDPANAYLFHACTDGLRFNYGGATPQTWDSTQASRSSLQTSYVNYIWLGTEGRGLSVFGENDKGWIVDKKRPTQELVRKGDSLYLVFHLISRPAEIKEARRIILGFQATPVKPMPKDWRKTTWGAPSQYLPYLVHNTNFLGSPYCYGGLTHSNELFPRDFDLSLWHAFAEVRKTKQIPKEFVRKWLAGYRDREMTKKVYTPEIAFGFHMMQNSPPGTLMFYTNARGQRLDIPESRTFLDDWFREEFQPSRNVPPEYGAHQSYSIDPTPSYRDFAVFWYHKMLMIGVTDNLYWDDIYLTGNWDHSGREEAYVMEDGSFQPSVGLFNIRALIRRAAVLMEEMGKTPQNMVHMTNTAIAPICAFAQKNLDWEDQDGIRPFQQRYTREYIRAVTLGRQFGNRPHAIGMISRDGDQEIQKMCRRSRAGVMITHEINTVPLDLYKFGYGLDHVRVWNYWEKGYPVKISGETSSLLSSKKGEAVLIVCNYDHSENFTAKLDRKKLGFTGPLSAVDGETREAIAVHDDTLAFKIKQFDYITIRIQENGRTMQ